MAKIQILSPLPGTFYRRPAPDKPPYKEVGDGVAKGDVVGLIEVMKTFYEVKAEADGKLKQFLVEDEDAVQAGQPLAELGG
jgi:biotin carboxyl carrier protein